MPPTTQAAMGRHARCADRHAAADRRPGLWRRDPVRALHPVGGRTLPRHRDRLQRARCGRCCGRSRRPRGSSFAGRMRRTTRRSARCPACRGWPARASTTCPRRYRICAPTRPAPRSGRSDWTAWCHAGFRRVGVIWAGRPTHNNDRNRSALLADFRPLANVRGSRAARVAEGTEDRPGRGVLWPRAADQHRRRDRGLRRHDGDPRQPRSAGHGRYVGRASGRRDGAAGVDHAAARAGLALAARSRAIRPGIRPYGCSVRQSVRRWDDVAKAIAAELAARNWSDPQISPRR